MTDSMFRHGSQTPAPDFVTPRGGRGPEQPGWADVQTYLAEWYRRFRDWHHERYPDSDPITRANLDDAVRRHRNGT